jgi:repressor LexA
MFMKKTAKDGSAPVLNDRQKRILEYIREFISTKGFPPTVREIGKAVGLSSSASVHANLHKLADMGILSRDQDKPRAIMVTEDAAWRQKTVVPVPLVGSVHAGQPILAVENIEETYPIPLDLLGCQDDVFMMAVVGDSMKNAGILEHDYIFVRKQNFANNGDVVVALINGEETTIKRYFRELKQIRLQPENEAYNPILGTDNIQIMGKVIAVFRML